ncbi:dihydrofolate reductase family protein [Phytomonospora endophytica]|uniref:Dihydrofolate reductase n=1 Tax=Phytomonospora endophytica TaxID=714109 RepID=A0A841FZS3_9ACTN|nr:dihydrofolate reductase family protein [Phytomonospora endophytica]MBB6039022.1 dihydrofolate reductase [Phytomonospora endophytica]GIG69500.1 deaminase [Phytomonospora endophytica]
MTIVTASMMISVDGFIAGSGISADNAVGDGGAVLHEWVAELASWRARQGMEGGLVNTDDGVIREWFDGTGAVVMGRMMFDQGEAFWGEDPPFRTPVFIVTNRPRPTLELEGGNSYTFVTDGVASAVARAKAVAGDRDVDIAGGADVFQQALAAGLVDEVQLHLVPVLLGAGVRLFGDFPAPLELVRNVDGEGGTHLKYRVIK